MGHSGTMRLLSSQRSRRSSVRRTPRRDPKNRQRVPPESDGARPAAWAPEDLPSTRTSQDRLKQSLYLDTLVLCEATALHVPFCLTNTSVQM